MDQWLDRRVLDLLGMDHPILLAPMAGACSADLVAAVSNAGGLGSYGAAPNSPASIRRLVATIRSKTDRPFNINLFARSTQSSSASPRPTPDLRAQLESFHRELGLGELPDAAPLFGPADAQLEVLLELEVPVVSFHFGVDQALVDRAHVGGAKVLCTATTVSEARLLEDLGVDAIIAQGAEAGGHRGTFAANTPDALIGTMALVPQVVDAVSVPVIAAGGIMDGRGLVACLALGASAVQMGTAFLGCPETPIADAWRSALHASRSENTTVTKVFSGRPARAIRNRFVTEMEAQAAPLLPFPSQFSLGRALRRAAKDRGDPEFLACWAGQGLGLLRDRSAAELMRELCRESRGTLDRLRRPQGAHATRCPHSV
jgi:nitronate monooxygenase